MNTKYIWSAVVVVAIIALIGIVTPKVSNTGVRGISDSTNFTNIGLGVNDRYVVTSAQRKDIGASSNIACSFLSPNATTSLQLATVLLTSNGVATTTSWEIATSSTATATTSTVTTFNLASTQNVSFAWNAGVNNSIVSPNTYVNVGVQTASSTAPNGLAGDCEVVFVAL